jgi:hypothetical protein
MRYPRAPKGVTAPDGISRLAVTAAASAETGNDAGGVYCFRVFGQEVFLTFGAVGTVVDPTALNGLPITEADGIVELEIPERWRFQAICTATETSSLAWWRGGER